MSDTRLQRHKGFPRFPVSRLVPGPRLSGAFAQPLLPLVSSRRWDHAAGGQ